MNLKLVSTLVIIKVRWRKFAENWSSPLKIVVGGVFQQYALRGFHALAICKGRGESPVSLYQHWLSGASFTRGAVSRATVCWSADSNAQTSKYKGKRKKSKYVDFQRDPRQVMLTRRRWSWSKRKPWSDRAIDESTKVKSSSCKQIKRLRKKKEQHGGARIESDSSWATSDTWKVRIKTSLNGHCRHNLYLDLISDSNIKIINAIYESYLIIMMTAPALIIHQQRNFLDAIASPCS